MVDEGGSKCIFEHSHRWREGDEVDLTNMRVQQTFHGPLPRTALLLVVSGAFSVSRKHALLGVDNDWRTSAESDGDRMRSAMTG